jgi:hypothetical protein
MRFDFSHSSPLLSVLLSSYYALGLCVFPYCFLMRRCTRPSILHLTYCYHLGFSWTCLFPPLASFCAGAVRTSTPSELFSLNLWVPLCRDWWLTWRFSTLRLKCEFSPFPFCCYSLVYWLASRLLCCLHDFPLLLLIRLKRIYNFWCSMLVFTPFANCFVTLSGTFMHFPELTY